jgi:FlaA1/EpsC-like NDP-sugar epimerase
MVAREIAQRPELGIEPVGFVDDDPKKVGMILQGLRVLGTTADLESSIHTSGATQALIAIGYLSGPEIRRITQLCYTCGIHAKAIPGIRDMVGGRLDLKAIRDVAIEDLLRRDPINLDTRAIAEIVADRTILVTGAGGSIGSQLCRSLCEYSPANLVLVDQAENGLFNLHRQLLHDFPQATIAPCVADICDHLRLQRIFARWSPELVFHAAAHKHVPLMEWNPGEAIKNNVLGTRTLANLADAFEVNRFVMISTDKAVNPTSVMGVSKRVAEIYIQALSQQSATQFVAVRFGNVLGSAGSVIPIFKEQLSRGGPITVTHPDMERFFMTIPEACLLVLQAASMGRGGEIYILDMGQPVKIVDLARDLIRLSGMSLDDVEICFTGMRPGEKLSEVLSRTEEQVEKTLHSKILVGRLCAQNCSEVNCHIDELESFVNNGQLDRIFLKLKEMVPEFEYTSSLQPFEEPALPNSAPRRQPAVRAAALPLT